VHERAEALANALKEPANGAVEEVARRLSSLTNSSDPVHVSRQRGGIQRNNDWALDPTQPTIITGTVDQIGSRLLFRSYGAGRLSQSIYAALVGTDSLILLDEAHCAQPFMQTADLVRRYMGKQWREQSDLIARPLQFVVLSATLPGEIQESDRFPAGAAERREALDHPLLRTRFEACKPAQLIVAKTTPPARPKDKHVIGAYTELAKDDPLVAHAADLTLNYVSGFGRKRVAVMVNRIATAAAIYKQLIAYRGESSCDAASQNSRRLDADVILLTGRTRPVDRDAMLKRWAPTLECGSRPDPDRPIVVVTTQCLEVGADFDFDALVTECASLDALRQRFGRLTRLG